MRVSARNAWQRRVFHGIVLRSFEVPQDSRRPHDQRSGFRPCPRARRPDRGRRHRRLPHPRKGALRVRAVRPRQHRLHRFPVCARRSDQDGIGASRVGVGIHGRCVLPRLRSTLCDVHLVRPRLGQHADCARQRVLRFGAVPGHHGKYPDHAVQPRRVSGDVSPLPGGLSVDREGVLQTRLSADTPRASRSADAFGLEDHGHRSAGPRGARRALRYLQGGVSRRNAAAPRLGLPISAAGAAPTPTGSRRPSTCCSRPNGP
jgi:hypothetical protein